MSDKIELRAEVPSELGGQRLDQVAAQLFAEHSRSRLSAWIKDGRLTVDGAVIRPRDIVHGGAILELTAEQEAQGEWIAQDIELDIVYEDDDILVINKPAGLVVHPAAGHADAVHVVHRHLRLRVTDPHRRAQVARTRQAHRGERFGSRRRDARRLRGLPAA